MLTKQNEPRVRHSLAARPHTSSADTQCVTNFASFCCRWTASRLTRRCSTSTAQLLWPCYLPLASLCLDASMWGDPSIASTQGRQPMPSWLTAELTLTNTTCGLTHYLTKFVVRTLGNMSECCLCWTTTSPLHGLQIHNSLNRLSFDTIQSELLTASLSKM